MVSEAELLVPLVVLLLSTMGTMIFLLLLFSLYALCAPDGGFRLGNGPPGLFDDNEQFRKEEEEALEVMDETARQSYFMAKRFVEQYPPNSIDTDISLSQYMMIQEKAVAAWEFQYDSMRQAVVVQNRTEIELFDSVCSVQTNLPLPQQNEVYYWEVKIFEMAPDARIGIGLTTKPYPLFRLPGMHKYSVAYESNGTRRLNQPLKSTKYGRPMLPGDVVGVGYRPHTGSVFFTHNGKRLDEVVHGMRMNLFPTVGSTGPCSVYVNLGQGGFVFIEANVKKWGLAPVQGTLAPPPAYGDRANSVLIQTAFESASPPRHPPTFEIALSDADEHGEHMIDLRSYPPPYVQHGLQEPTSP